MNNQIAFIFPGQGAQVAGMGKDFYDHFPIAKYTFQEADEILASHFSKMIFEGPSSELTLTKNSQLAIYIVSIAIWRTLKEQFPEVHPNVCAGLSLGEYTALTAAGKIDFAECLKLLQARALFMHEAALSHPGTMQAVLGLSLELVEEALFGVEGAWIAITNCPGQIVIAGKEAALSEAAPRLKDKGAKRVLQLEVSGAFHTALMQEAQDRLQPFIEKAVLKDSDIGFVSNVLGDYVSDLKEIRTCLLKQVSEPVLWEQGIRSIEAKGISLYYEIGPGKTLAGMNKRIGVLAPTYSFEKISSLEEIANAVTKG